MLQCWHCIDTHIICYNYNTSIVMVCKVNNDIYSWHRSAVTCVDNMEDFVLESIFCSSARFFCSACIYLSYMNSTLSVAPVGCAAPIQEDSIPSASVTISLRIGNFFLNYKQSFSGMSLLYKPQNTCPRSPLLCMHG